MTRPIIRERPPPKEAATEAASKPAAKEEDKEEIVQEKSNVRGPPKFGIGFGGMAGGGLLAEMKMRQERTSSFGKVSPLCF
jgi:hypothetical protein